MEAVKASKILKALKETLSVRRIVKTLFAGAAPSEIPVKHVDGKTFYLRNGVWVDAEYKEGMEAKEVEWGSEEFFRLLRERPKLGKYFALGERVIVVVEGKAIKVVPASS